jgi:hypothetical protein
LPASSGGPWLMYLCAGDYDNEFEIIHRNGDWRNIDPSGPGALPDPPTDIATDPASRTVYVADFAYTNILDSRIEKFTEDGRFLHGWQFYNAAGHSASIYGVAVNDNGDVFAAGDRRCVQIYSPKGQRIGEFACEMAKPDALAATGDGAVYVADAATDSVSYYYPVYPNASIASGPSGGAHWADATPQFAFASSQTGGSFNCRVDAGALAACPTPHTTGHLADGKHTISVRAVDGDDLRGPVKTTSFTIDTKAPKLKISGAPVKLTTGGAARIAVTCPTTEASGPCAGDLFLHTTDHRTVGGQKLDPLLGIATFSIRTGHTRRVTVKLPRRDRTILARLRSVKASVIVNVHDAVFNRRNGITKSFRLKARASQG